MNDFREGLEGIVAFRTEIAEPDREGGSLRYRGVDIEDLVGHVPFEQVWGLLVDDSLTPGLAPAEPFALPAATGDPVADLQAATARLSADWGLGKLIDISDDQAKEDLRRASSTMISIVAQSARLHDGEKTPVDPAVVASGATAAERFLLEWRGQADPRHVTAIDTYWICTAEHGMNASTFTARVVASTGADCAACLSSAVGALSGPLHGGAPARVLPMLDAAAEAASVDDYVKGLLDSGERLMGFGHRVYRAEDLARGSCGEQRRSSIRRDTRSRRSSSGWRSRSSRCVTRSGCSRRTSSSGRPSCSTSRRSRRHDACHVRVVPDGRLVGSHPRAEARRAPRPALGRVRRSLRADAVEHLVVDLAEVAARAAELTDERELSQLRHAVDEEIEEAARSEDFRQRAVAFRAIGQMRFRQKTELLRRGLEDESPACRGSALLSLEALSRDHAGVVNGQRSLLHQLANADPNSAVRRLAILALKNGSPHADTLVLLDHIADSDDEDRELRQTAAKTSDALKKKARLKRAAR